MTKTDTETLPAQIAKELGNALKAGKRPPLSVRQLAKDWQVAPGTVHKAMRLLCSQGILHAIPRKGFAPGKKTPIIADKADPLHKPPAETHADWLLSQFRSGQLDPFQPLPLLKELARIAGSAPPPSPNRCEFYNREEFWSVADVAGTGPPHCRPVRAKP